MAKIKNNSEYKGKKIFGFNSGLNKDWIESNKLLTVKKPLANNKAMATK